MGNLTITTGLEDPVVAMLIRVVIATLAATMINVNIANLIISKILQFSQHAASKVAPGFIHQR